MKSLELDAAVECAIRECIGQGILKEFLLKNRSEVKAVSIFEYNEEQHMKQEQEESYRYGKEDGLREGIQSYVQLCAEFGMNESEVILKLVNQFGLTESEAKKFAENHLQKTIPHHI